MSSEFIIGMLTLVKLAILIFCILSFFEMPAGKKIAKFLPTPFWVYFISILSGTFGLLPQKSVAYYWAGTHLLPMSLVLLLIGTPIFMLRKIGPKAFLALLLATCTMFVGAIISFAIFRSYLPIEGWKMAGTMLGTWTGGSANMLAVKELVDLSDSGYGPLIIADTFLSYGWLALLMMGVAYQKWFDRKSSVHLPALGKEPSIGKEKLTSGVRLYRLIVVILVGLAVGETMLIVGGFLNPAVPFLSKKAWAILLSTSAALGLAATRLNNLEKWNASKMGTFFLYMVLASMGAKTNLSSALDAPAVFFFASLMMLIHGGLLFPLGRFFKLPLFLLATASQANVGGPVSAPIVASVYRPHAAQFGVLMAILGAVLGTYVGGLGAWICKMISQ